MKSKDLMSRESKKQYSLFMFIVCIKVVYFHIKLLLTFGQSHDDAINVAKTLFLMYIVTCGLLGAVKFIANHKYIRYYIIYKRLINDYIFCLKAIHLVIKKLINCSLSH